MTLTKEQIQLRLSSQGNILNSSHFSSQEFSQEPEDQSGIIVEEETSDSSEIIYKGNNFNLEGKKKGTKNLTEEEKVTLGALANLTDIQTASSIFGVGTSVTKRMKNGITNKQGNSWASDPVIKQKIEARLSSTKLSIQERAAEKLLASLGVITSDKLENCSVKDAAQVANQMSQVVRNMTKNEESQGKHEGPKVKIVLHQPKPSKESYFDCIEVAVGE